MSTSDPVPDKLVFQRWRVRLLVVLCVFTLGAAASLAISVAYGESLVLPVLLWVGVGCVFMAWRTVPRRIGAEERPTMARSATWTALAVVAYVVVPVVLSQTGVVSG
jgi:hypothetical protein